METIKSLSLRKKMIIDKIMLYMLEKMTYTYLIETGTVSR